jgi:hypothetical protein
MPDELATAEGATEGSEKKDAARRIPARSTARKFLLMRICTHVQFITLTSQKGAKADSF